MPKETLKSKKERSLKIHETLLNLYPNLTTFLTHKNPFELLIAVILSAQCTDERVNKTTPGLFKKYPTPEALAKGQVDEIAETIKSINFFNNKAKNIQKTAELLVNNHNSTVPSTLDELIKLPGVGRKTANVVLGQAFNTPGITVDTHVNRVTRRLGLTTQKDAVKIEYDLMKVWPDSIWSDMSSLIIYHGRQTCPARKPNCEACAIAPFCPQKIE